MMFCSQCRLEFDDNAKYCDQCGAPLTGTIPTRLVCYKEGRFNSIYMFEDMTYDELTSTVHEIFTSRNYKMKKSFDGNPIYKKGSVVANHEYKVEIYPESEKMCLKLKRLLTLGFGAIGGSEIASEYKKIKKLFRGIK